MRWTRSRHWIRPIPITRSSMRWAKGPARGHGRNRPSVSKVKSVGTYFHAGLSISKSQVSTYQANGIKVFMFTGKNEDDYATMAARNPYGVVVDDSERFQKWRNQQR